MPNENQIRLEEQIGLVGQAEASEGRPVTHWEVIGGHGSIRLYIAQHLIEVPPCVFRLISTIIDYRVRPILDTGIDDGVGGLVQRLVPADPLPFAFAALSHPLERVLDPILPVHLIGEAAASLAAHRAWIRHFLIT